MLQEGVVFLPSWIFFLGDYQRRLSKCANLRNFIPKTDCAANDSRKFGMSLWRSS